MSCESEEGVLVYVIHLGRLFFPVRAVILDDAEAINPEVLYTKPST